MRQIWSQLFGKWVELIKREPDNWGHAILVLPQWSCFSADLGSPCWASAGESGTHWTDSHGPHCVPLQSLKTETLMWEISGWICGPWSHNFRRRNYILTVIGPKNVSYITFLMNMNHALLSLALCGSGRPHELKSIRKRSNGSHWVPSQNLQTCRIRDI